MEQRTPVSPVQARIAGDIHDIVGNRLSAIALQSTAAMATAARGDQKLLAALTEIRESSLEGISEVRRMVAALRGGAQGAEPVPTSLDLGASLMKRMEALGFRTTLWTVGAPVALSAEVETTACRIIQESLTNVLKYACGAAVDTLIAFLPGRLVVTVENDLSAANPDLMLTGSGFGLTAMAERARRIGGTCTARPVGNRWRVRAELPLSPPGPDRLGQSCAGKGLP